MCSGDLSSPALLRHLLGFASEAGADGVTLWKAEAGHLRAIANPVVPELRGTLQPLGAGLISQVYLTGQSILEDDLPSHPAHNPGVDHGTGKRCRTMIAAPVDWGDEGSAVFAGDLHRLNARLRLLRPREAQRAGEKAWPPSEGGRMVKRRPWPARDACLDALRHGDRAGVKIAVLQTGIDASHPDLSHLSCAGSWKAGIAIWETSAPADPVCYGTATTGIVHRLSPRAEIIAVTVLDPGQRQQRHNLIRCGARHAMREGAPVLNCSFRMPGTAYTLRLYKDWTKHAYHGGHLVLASSSNDGPAAPEWPAYSSQVLAVAGGELAAGELESSEGHPVPWKAAGSGIEVPVPGSGHSQVTGSSFDASHVTAMPAHLLSVFPGLYLSMARDSLEHFFKEAGR